MRVTKEQALEALDRLEPEDYYTRGDGTPAPGIVLKKFVRMVIKHNKKLIAKCCNPKGPIVCFTDDGGCPRNDLIDI